MRVRNKTGDNSRIQAWLNLAVFIICLSIFAFTGNVADAREIRIGVLYPLSGSHKETGQSLKDAANLAAKIVNGSYNFGIPGAYSKGLSNHGGAKLKLIYADHKGDPELGRSEAERLISEKKVHVLLGCYNSSVTATASEVAESKNVPFLSASSTSPGLTDRGFQWFFRITPHDGLFAKNFYQFLDDVRAKYNKNIKRVAIFNENTIWGSGVANAELFYGQQFDYDIVMTLQYPQNSKTLGNEIKLLISSKPDILFQASYLSDSLLSIQTYKKMGLRPELIIGMNAGFLSPELIQGLGEEADGLFSREVWASDLHLTKPIIKGIGNLFRIRTGKALNGNSARVMTGVFVIAEAINRTKHLNRNSIKTALEETDISGDKLIMPWKGIRFDRETHQNTLGQGIIVQIQQQKYHTVWPFELASRKISWPR